MLRSNAGRARGASLVEVVVLLGLTAFVASAGARVFGLHVRSVVLGQAACVAALDGSTCVPGEAGDAAGVRKTLVDDSIVTPAGGEAAAVRVHRKAAPSSPTGSLRAFPDIEESAPEAMAQDDGSVADDIVRLHWRTDCCCAALVQMNDLGTLSDPSTDPEMRAVLDWYWNDPTVELPPAPWPNVSRECFWKAYMDWRACGRASPNPGEIGQAIAEAGCE